MKLRIISVILAITILLPFLCTDAAAESYVLSRKYDRRTAALTELLMEDEKTLKKIDELEKKAVFISVSDGYEKAVTVYGTGNKLETAIERALNKAKATNIQPRWYKLDVVTSVEETAYTDFVAKYKEYKLEYAMRKGISFNSYFGRALLESQINSSGMLSYETGELDLDKINKHFTENGKLTLDKIPETLYLFDTQGYFSDSPSSGYKLTKASYSKGGNREYEITPETIEELAESTSSYLAGICEEDGKFVYGYYPIDNEEIEGYNIIRHAGTVWNLILQYEITGDKALLEPIERALEYLEGYVHYKDSNTAFINDRGTLNVGGNGISLLAYVSYANATGSTKYHGLIRALANGIIYLQKNDGGFIHTIRKADYSIYQEYVVVFYDGEAMYGLLKAYDLLRDRRYLFAAEKAGNYFINNNYEDLHSHWIAYSFNELTKFVPRQHYFEFGLKNINNYLDTINRTSSAAHTTCETTGATFELYDRLIKSGIECEYLEEFNDELLIEAFNKRVNYGVNFFMPAEKAMYFENPQSVLNSFVIREDSFRIRIDDIQHFMGGYYLYYKNYDLVKEYTEAEE